MAGENAVNKLLVELSKLSASLEKGEKAVTKIDEKTGAASKTFTIAADKAKLFLQTLQKEDPASFGKTFLANIDKIINQLDVAQKAVIKLNTATDAMGNKKLQVTSVTSSTVGGTISGGSLQSLQEAVNKYQRMSIEAKNLTENTNKADSATKKLASNLEKTGNEGSRHLARLENAVNHLANNMLLFGAASGVALFKLLKGGTETADTMKVLEISLRGITGSQERANELMQQMKKYAEESKTPFNEVVAASQQLAPNLKLANIPLDRMVEALNVTKRLSLLNLFGPGGGQEGAAVALTEALQGDFISLRRRFNISPTVFKGFLKQAGGDEIKALNLLLNNLGITAETAAESNMTLAKTMERLGSSINVTLSQTLMPFLNKFVIPFIDQLGMMISKLNEVNPLLAQLGTGGTLMALASVPMAATGLKGISTALSLRRSLVEAGIMSAPATGATGGGAAIGTMISTIVPIVVPVAVVAVMAMIGALIGLIIAKVGINTFGRLTGNKELEKQTTEQTFDHFLKFIDKVGSAGLNAITQFQLAILKTINPLTEFTARLASFPSILQGVVFSNLGKITGNKTLSKLGAMGFEDADTIFKSIKSTSDGILDNFTKMSRETELNLRDAMNNRFRLEKTGGSSQQSVSAGGISDEILTTLADDWQAYLDQVQQSENNYQKERQKSLAEHYQALKELDDELNIERVRLWTDFVNNQEKEDRKFNIDLANAEKDGQEKRQSIIDDHNKRVIDIQKSYQEGETNRLAEHQLRMQRMAEDHELALEDAAGRLDAIAFYREQQKYDLDRQRAEEDFNNETAQRKDQFKEAMKQEQDNFKDRLKEFDRQQAERIAQMKAEFAQKQSEERADFEQRMALWEADAVNRRNKMIDDFNEKLTLADAMHQEELAQLQAQFNDKAQKALGLQDQYQNASLSSLQTYLQAMKAKFDALLGAVTTTSTSTGSEGTTSRTPTPIDIGGDLKAGEIFRAHADEYVLRGSTANAIRNMMGGDINEAALASGNFGNGGILVNIDTPINVYGANGDVIEQIRRLFRPMLISELKEALRAT